MKTNNMKTEMDWNREIQKIKNEINNIFPELHSSIELIPLKKTQHLGVNNLQEYYVDIVDLVNDHSLTDKGIDTIKNSDLNSFSLYPHYPVSDDIFNRGREVDLNPEDLSPNHAPKSSRGKSNEKGFEDDMSGDDLDIPGAELDDEQENVGSEDEENNHYSLGGDNHNNLDEDNG